MGAFLETSTRLKAENLHLLKESYSLDIHFTDPAYEPGGLVQLEEYFRSLYAILISIHFEFLHPERVGAQGYVQWLMTYAHPRLNGSRTISVPGTTFLQFKAGGKACVHRDYFDLGAMIYQLLPILAFAVRIINRRLGR